MLLCTTASAQQTDFHKALEQQSGIYNGREFEFYHPSIEGSAFFQDATFFNNGSIVYGGFEYHDVPLMYDMHKDLVVGLYHDGYSKYSLISEQVSEFKLLGHHFVRIAKDSTTTAINTGFYDQIYDGKLKVLVKRYRELKEESSIQDLKNIFRANNKYYIKRDQQYFNVGSKKAFMKLFKERKSQLQRVLKDANVTFRKEPERALVLLATTYDNPSN